MDSRSTQRGFTLLELMIVIAIIGILGAIAIPAYQTYADRSRFSEVILSAASYKSAAEIAVQTNRATVVADLDAGNLGIPTANTGIIGAFVASVTMQNGIITAVSQNLNNDASYALTGTITNGGINWSEGGSCIAAGLC